MTMTEPKTTPEQRDEMLTRRAAGQSMRQIAADYGVSHEWVRIVCEREGVVPIVACRRCGDTFEQRAIQSAHLCPACRERRCTVCGEPFTRDQLLADDGDAHRSCRRVIRGAMGGTTYRSVETGIYQRIYKTTGTPLKGFTVYDHATRTYHRYPNITQARRGRKEILARRAAKE